MTKFKALNDEICLLPTNIDSELFKTFKEDFPDDLPIVLLKKEDLQIFFENMYDIKDIETYNICANVASYLIVNDYYPYHYLNGITSSEGLHKYYKIPDYIFTLNIEEIIEAGDLQFIIIKNLANKSSLVQYEVFNYNFNKDVCSYSQLWNYACSYGQLNIIIWLYKNRDEKYKEDVPSGIAWAALNGHLDVVKWLHKNTDKGYTPFTMNWAAKNGHLNVVIWLNTHRTEGCGKYAMDMAATNGHLDVVKWLHENRNEGCTTDAMTGAAKNGYLDIVIWLHKNRDEGCTKHAMNCAAQKGKLDVIKWLYENREEGCITSAIKIASRFDHTEVVEYLQSIV